MDDDMDFAAFKASVAGAAPPEGLAPALDALWWQAKGDWARAHAIVQAQDDPACAWVHAHLHRVEGDAANAGYWYRRAGRPHAGEPHADAPLTTEWEAIATALL